MKAATAVTERDPIVAQCLCGAKFRASTFGSAQTAATACARHVEKCESAQRVPIRAEASVSGGVSV